MKNMSHQHYHTAGGVRIQRSCETVDYPAALEELLPQLDSCRGVLLSSSFEYPGRYTRWDIGFINPPLCISSRGRHLRISSLNRRGAILLPECVRALQAVDAIASLEMTPDGITVMLRPPAREFTEEQRSRQPGVFSVLRALSAHLASAEDSYLGLYGAFAYDLAFQFEPVAQKMPRPEDSRDLVLYLPDEILVADHYSRTARVYRYDFVCRSGVEANAGLETTGGLRRTGSREAFSMPDAAVPACDHLPGEYAATVHKAREAFRRGDLFEVVPGQIFSEPCTDTPSAIFRRLRESNPAPYGALMNLGQQEYLVAASPEMYVRVRGDQVETCPISGTIARGVDAIADAHQIRELLNSEKDEAELSMCTDVDRNDKSRVCIPGSVRVAGRRQVELYSRLIHTVDHVKGTLAPGYDAMDAFLAHTWAVTVTGAPKPAAMQFIENHEKSPRRWYGGAIGCLGFDGNMNTGLTLRTVRIHKGIAEVRAGATLLMDSDPEAEEAETRLKASALLAAIRGEQAPDATAAAGAAPALAGAGALRVLMVDHQDSFVHNLAAYFREQGVQLLTMRSGLARKALSDPAADFDLVILSPGPGEPGDFQLSDTLELCLQRRFPVFGVCLGLQGIVEYFGGSLAVLPYPVHGKPSLVRHRGSALFAGIEKEFTAGRYHSLYARTLPDCLRATATSSDDEVVMAVEHCSLPVMAVQFHPESILSLAERAGHKLIRNVVQYALTLQQCRQAAGPQAQQQSEECTQHATEGHQSTLPV